jgi:bifunctional UDP-N-acetylglucosamine pyrophosphorylase/glucosamine-1-phosphate N-acetyltransferase
MEGRVRELAVIVLAAGQGTRMKSRRAKVLHEVCGRSLLDHVLTTAEALQPARLQVVVGRGADEVQQAFAGRADFALQAEQRGTGHAALQALPKLNDFRGDVLVLYADTPLLRAESLAQLQQMREDTGADLVMLTSPEPLPGLIVRDSAGRVQRVVERTDATPEELKIREGNTGVYLLDIELLREGLAQLDDSNEQGELYLTDIVGHAVSTGRVVEAIQLEDATDCLGVNTRAELAAAGAVLRRNKLAELMAQGVEIVDPDSTWIDVQVEIGQDTCIEPGCVIQGDTVIGEGVHLKPHCMIEESRIDDGVVMGPSAHLRPGTHLMDGVRLGNFVEIKNSTLGRGVKADHLAYIGDADVGEGASFSCGAITVNYDWQGKHRTVIGKGSTVGCNANLIAPVVIGDNAAVAAGSTITGPVPDDALAVARARQRNVEGWVARREGRALSSKSTEKRTAAKKAASKKSPAVKKSKPATSSKKAPTSSKKKVAAKKKSSAPRSAAKKKSSTSRSVTKKKSNTRRSAAKAASPAGRRRKR